MKKSRFFDPEKRLEMYSDGIVAYQCGYPNETFDAAIEKLFKAYGWKCVDHTFFGDTCKRILYFKKVELVGSDG